MKENLRLRRETCSLPTVPAAPLAASPEVPSPRGGHPPKQKNNSKIKRLGLHPSLPAHPLRATSVAASAALGLHAAIAATAHVGTCSWPPRQRRASCLWQNQSPVPCIDSTPTLRVGPSGFASLPASSGAVGLPTPHKPPSLVPLALHCGSP